MLPTPYTENRSTHSKSSKNLLIMCWVEFSSFISAQSVSFRGPEEQMMNLFGLMSWREKTYISTNVT